MLEALDYLNLGIDNPNPRSLVSIKRADEHEIIPIGERSNFNGTIEILAEVGLSDQDLSDLGTHLEQEHGFVSDELPKKFTVRDRYLFKNSRFERRTGMWAFNPRGKFKRARTLKPLVTNRPSWESATDYLLKRAPSIWYFPNFLFEFPKRIYLQPADEETEQNRFYRNLFQGILSATDSGATIEEHISNRIESQDHFDKEFLEQLLLKMGRRISQDVFRQWNAIFSRQANTDARITAGIDETGQYIELSITDSDGYYHISERSLGFRWFFVFSLITIYTNYPSDGNRSRDVVFLLDEPASNLHAAAQSQLLKGLEPLSEHSTIIYTTHSHHMINPNWLENTYVVRNKGLDINSAISNDTARRTDITIETYRSFANAHPTETDYFQPILDVLDYKPSSLEMVADVVFVEGKNDFYTLSYMNEVIIGNPKDFVRLIPGNGAGSLEAVIRLYLGWARSFIVLLDSDFQSEKEKDRYENIFGPIVNGRVTTLGSFRPDLEGKSLEKAFEKIDRDSIMDTTYPGQTYNKKLFNRAIQECLAARTPIQITKPTVERFKDILNALRTSLSNYSGTGVQ